MMKGKPLSEIMFVGSEKYIVGKIYNMKIKDNSRFSRRVFIHFDILLIFTLNMSKISWFYFYDTSMRSEHCDWGEVDVCWVFLISQKFEFVLARIFTLFDVSRPDQTSTASIILIIDPILLMLSVFLIQLLLV